MKVFLHGHGCRLNQGEMEGLGRKLLAAGHEVVDDPRHADRFVLNTCAVTREAARDARRWARRQHRLRPDAPIFLTGCYATVAPGELAPIEGVTRVVPNAEKEGLLTLLDPEASPEITGLEVLGEPAIARRPGGGAPPFVPSAAPLPALAPAHTRTRAFVKVQDGCDKRCTFCITTVARGAGTSRRQGDVVREIQALASAGHAEVVLSGVHLGSYGQDLGRPEGLRELVEAVLDRTDIPRIRLSSLEPWNVAPGFFELWRDPRLMPHLHLPLQSGSDRILRKMARETDRAAYRAIVRAARAAIPDLNITTDIICGFPGEQDADFEQSLDFVEEVGFGGLHVFGYSERPGTAAARMSDPVPVPLRRERVGRMIALGRAMSLRFHQRFEGRQMDVLWERGREVEAAVRSAAVATIPLAELSVAGEADAPRAAAKPSTPLVDPGGGAPSEARSSRAPNSPRRSRMRYEGYTPNYISVSVEMAMETETEIGPPEQGDRRASGADLRGRVERVRLTGASAEGMLALSVPRDR